MARARTTPRKIASLGEQLRNNAIALLSLVFAVSSLAYTTWRNEETELNRNIRTAGFEILRQLGELQLVVDYAHYDRDPERGNPITGWGRVLMIRDLAPIMPAPVPDKATDLQETWGVHWALLREDRASAERVTQAIDGLREATRAALAELE